MDTTGGYQSLLGLTSINSNSSTIDVLNVENITINGVIDLSQAIVGGLTTSQVDEGLNLYYTDTRVNNNSNVSSNTTHRDRTDNPHGVTATQVGIDDTDDISEGVTNLYYTDIRFDNRLATKTTSNLTEGSNLYYTDARFDTRLATKTTDNLTEGTNLYYTTARANADFDTRLATKTTTNLAEGTNLYYTDVRFDTRLLSKTTTDLAEGANLYYTDARFDTRLLSKTTTDLAEGANLYYTDARFDTRLSIKTTTDLAEGTNLYYTDARFDTRLLSKTTTDLAEGANLYYTTTRANADFDTRLATKTTTNLAEGTNLYYTEARVSANTDVKANSDYRAVGHLPLAGGTLTGDLDMNYNTIEGVNLIEITADETTPVWTSDTTNDGIGWYIATSNNDRLPVYLAFNNTYGVGADGNDAWFPSDLTGNYNIDGTVNTASVPTTTLADASVLYGEWIQIANTNREMQMTSFILATRNHPWYSYPTDFTILGSQDGTSWYVVYETTGLTFSSQAEFKTIVTPPNGYYKYFRFIVQRVTSTVVGNVSAGYPRIGEWRPSFVYSGNLDMALIEDVKANTAKVSADGSIDTHSDVSILTVQDQQFLKYSSFTQKWANVTATTAMIAEQNNLYYTDARFDTRFATKTTTNLTEGTNLYYTEARFDTSFGVKKTTDLTEGINLYYTDGRFDTRLATKTTDNLTEGTNLYYTEARVSANTDVKANSDYRAVGHLPLAGGIMTGDIIWDTDIEIPTWVSDTVYTPSDDPNWSISSSSIYSSDYRTYEAFNKTVDGNGTNCWISAAGRYNTNGTVNASTYTTTQVDGSNSYQGEWIQVQHTEKKLRLTSFILTARSKYTEYSKYYRLLGTNDDPNGSPNWTTLMYNTTQLVWSSPGASLVLTPDGVLGYYNTYRLLITQCTIAYCSIARFIPSFVLEGNTISNVFSINGSHVDTLIADVSANTAKVSYPSADSTKVGFISVTQAVDLDAMESDIATNNNKVSYPSADSTKVGFISVTQAVNLDTMESDIATNNNKVSYPSADSTKVGFISVTQAVDLDAMESDIATNNNKVSYPSADSTKVGFISVTQAVDLDAMESDIATNNNKVSYPSADSTKVGFISVTQAVNLDTMETDITSNNAYRNVGHLPLEGGTMTGDITMGGQAPTTYNGPTMTSATAPSPYVITSSSSLAAGSQYQAFDGLNYNAWESTPNTRYDSSGVLIGEPYPRPISDIKYYGEWIQVDLGANYIIPSYSIDPTNTAGGAPKSWTVGVSPDGATFTLLDRKIDQTYAVETTFTPTTPLVARYIVMSIDKVSGSAGKVIMTGLSYEYETPNYSIYNLKEPTDSHYAATKGYVDSNVQTLNTAISGKLSLSGGTMTGNLNMGNQDIDNVNQVFVNRSGLANNKLVLYDGGSGSTTSFYGLGIQNSTLLYNVDGSGANHRFYYGGTNEVFRIGNSGVYTYRGLGVTGNVLMSTNSRILIDDSTSSVCGIRWADDNHAVYCYRTANQMYIKEYGTIYFQTTGANTRAYINSSGLTNLSDRRKKSGIREMKCCGLDLINALKPVCFTHIGAERENCGFIAQDIEELVEQKKICFNPVSDNRIEKEDGSVDEFKGLCYIDFIAPLVKAVQELSAEVKTLKAEVELLKSPII